jgi:lipopolysaccharide biosynthesis regulator YciM
MIKPKRIALLTCLAALLSLGSIGTANAQDEEPPQRETKKAEALTKPVYEKLTKAQELLEADDYDGALRILNDLARSDKLSNFERANVTNYFAFVYYSKGDVDRAIKSYEDLLRIEGVEPGMASQTIYTLAQLYATQENYTKTLEYLNRWFPTANNPAPEAYVLLAQAYSQTGEYRKMIEPLKTAIAEQKRRDKEVREDWYNLMYYAYYQLEDYANVRDTLKTLIAGWPKKNYWLALGGIYSELNDEKNMVAVYEALDTQGLLTSESELVTLAQLYLQAEVPYKGAKVLEAGMQAGTISKNAKNYRLLSQAWTLAADNQKAIPALQQAAALSSDGDLNASLAISYLNTDQFSDCVQTGREGLEKGGLRNESDLRITIGMCLYNLDRLDDARAEFRRAARDERSTKLAEQWIQVIDSDKSRLAQLQQALQSAG